MVVGHHTYVEVMLALGHRLEERDARSARAAFDAEWARLLVVALDHDVCRRAAVIGAMTGTRTLDALHLAAAQRAGGSALRFLTFDMRLAQAARSIGFIVVGA